MEKTDFDLIIIGGGESGRTAAKIATKTKLKTAIIDANGLESNINDENFTTFSKNGDILPSSAINFSSFLNNFKQYKNAGLSYEDIGFNYPIMQEYILNLVQEEKNTKRKELEKNGIKYIDGFAQFISPNEVSVKLKNGKDKILSAKKFILATGSILNKTGISGLENPNCISPSEVINLPKLPKVALVIGGGASGCEIASYLSGMGVQVILVELSERLLPNEDPEVGELIEKCLIENGVKVLTGSRVVAVEKSKKEVLPSGRRTEASRIVLLRGGQEKAVKVEKVILAAGKTPAVDFGLKNAKVKYSNYGIKTTEYLQTSAKHIFAVGDVADIKLKKREYITKFSSSEKAIYEASIATSNLINKTKGIIDYRGFTRNVNTILRVATVGITEDECIARGIRYKQALVPFRDIPASQEEYIEDGFVKIIVDREKKIIGASIVAPEADNLIQEIILAMRANLKLLDLATTPHHLESKSEAIRIAARKLLGIR